MKGTLLLFTRFRMRKVCPCQPDAMIWKTQGFFRFLPVANEMAGEFLRHPVMLSIERGDLMTIPLWARLPPRSSRSTLDQRQSSSLRSIRMLSTAEKFRSFDGKLPFMIICPAYPTSWPSNDSVTHLKAKGRHGHRTPVGLDASATHLAEVIWSKHQERGGPVAPQGRQIRTIRRVQCADQDCVASSACNIKHQC